MSLTTDNTVVCIVKECVFCIVSGFMNGYVSRQQQDAHEFLLCCIKQLACDAQ